MNADWENDFLICSGSKVVESLGMSQSSKKTFDRKQYLREYTRWYNRPSLAECQSFRWNVSNGKKWGGRKMAVSSWAHLSFYVALPGDSLLEELPQSGIWPVTSKKNDLPRYFPRLQILCQHPKNAAEIFSFACWVPMGAPSPGQIVHWGSPHFLFIDSPNSIGSLWLLISNTW